MGSKFLPTAIFAIRGLCASITERTRRTVHRIRCRRSRCFWALAAFQVRCSPFILPYVLFSLEVLISPLLSDRGTLPRFRYDSLMPSRLDVHFRLPCEIFLTGLIWLSINGHRSLSSVPVHGPLACAVIWCSRQSISSLVAVGVIVALAALPAAGRRVHRKHNYRFIRRIMCVRVRHHVANAGTGASRSAE